MTEPEKMPLTSMDIAAQRRGELRALFPSVFTETKNEKGELVESIDFEKLKAELGTFSDVFEARRERYGFDWPGKKDCLSPIQHPSAGTLKPTPSESLNFDTTKNLFIEGDNLEAMKLLQKSYYGRIKLIYIDPPYNTGREFIYPDKFSETLETYLAYAGLVDSNGLKFSSNSESDGRYHTKWLNMLYPRLYLARNLLSEDGFIFLSIDENELDNLKKLCNEVFGEANFVGLITRATGTRMGTGSRGIARELDYLLVYSKTDDQHLRKLPMSKSEKAIYDQQDERGRYLSRSLRRTGGENRREDRPSMYFPVLDPDGNEVYPIAPEGYESRWVCGKETYEQMLKDGFIEWRKVSKKGVEKWQVYQKHYLVEATKESSNLWNSEDGNKKATKELSSLFGGVKLFDHPKPIGLLKKIIQLGTAPDEEHIVLDFFAGSATTGHAVFEQNKEDGGNRRFILIQIPEKCEPSSTAAKKGFRNIAEIGKERLRLASKQIASEVKGQLDLETSQQICDLGMRVFKLDRSCFKPWDGRIDDAAAISRQLELHIDHIDSEASNSDILYEILLRSGFDLTSPIEELSLKKAKVFSISDGAMLICLEDEITRELIDAVAEAEPMQFICLDRAFKGNDQLKANAVQTFAARNQGREKAEQIIFRTV